MPNKKEQEIVDLVPSKGGVYSTKSTHHSKLKEEKQIEKPKKVYENMDEFFNGMDAGLDFVEGMSKRISRMLKLRD